jgi:hypothetical protein
METGADGCSIADCGTVGKIDDLVLSVWRARVALSANDHQLAQSPAQLSASP